MPRFLSPFILLSLIVAIAGCDQQNIETRESENISTTVLSSLVISESERLTQWFDEHYEEALSRSPMTLTQLGRKDSYDQIDDASEAAAEFELQWYAQSVNELEASFDYDVLSNEARVSYDLWIYQYENAQALAPFRRHNYFFEQMSAPHASLPNFLINLHSVSNEEEMLAYITRIGGISHRIDQLLERAQMSAEESVRPPQFAYQIVIEQSLALISGSPFTPDSENEAPLWSDAKTKIDGLVTLGEIEESRAFELLSLVEMALLENFEPSYLSLINWLESDFNNADSNAKGVGSLNNGDAYYNAMLNNMTTTDLSADEIYEIGISEVARIKFEMEIIKEQVEFDGTLQEFFTFIKTDDRFRYPNNDEGRQGYLDDSTTFINEMREKIPNYFGILPKAALEVKRVEYFREQDGAAQHYRPGTADGSRPGTYYAHLSDMTSMPRYDMETVAYHEGIPGHHMQISIQQELTGVPEFRKLPDFTSYIEGWALYSEYLAREMGGFEDPYKNFGRLNAEIWRAIRLVVDTGIHAKGWSEEQAVAYFQENSSISDGQIRSEVKRYIVLPGQATSYKIGMMKILELRNRAEIELGDNFDIREFHDVVLGGGSVPLTILENMVDQWLVETLAAN